MTGPILNHLQMRELNLGPLTEAARKASPWQHWSLARDEQQVAWLLLDRADAAVNSLSEAVLLELGEILEQLSAELPSGLVLRSAKVSGFCVGADISEFRELKDAAEIVPKLQQAHAIADRLAALSCPTVAVIHGGCLGGGLELALCCDYRLALPDAKLGLPEILLGLHPGLGGTARLTHLIDPIEAMTLMLTGRTLDARRAKKSGLVDSLIEERHVARAVAAAVAGDIKGHDSGMRERLLTTTPARHLEARQMRAKSAEKANPAHYPAPEALIRLWEEHGGDAEAMRREEIASFAGLLSGATAQNLVRVFFLREKLKRTGKAANSGIERVHVIGAGAMGGDIAAWCALQGLQVSLFDTQVQSLAGAVKRTAELCRKRRLCERETQAVLDRLIPDLKNRGVASADLVLEAVPEQLDLKREIFRQLEPQLKADALLATNTSSIPLEELAEKLQNPGRFVGLHFFNPVAKMQLVEVVEPKSAATESIARARAFVGRIGRLPVPVSSAPGFLVNRVLMPYLLEAILLFDEGVDAETIDRAAEAFGMPLGPLELADQVGLDICLAVAEMLRERLEQRIPQVPGWLHDKLEKGELGRKTGQGFYAWEQGKPQKREEKPEADAELLDRLLLPLLNSCMACLREGVVTDEELLDGAMIFGTGFAPFRGGPLHYARSRGSAEIAEKLAALAQKHGERFTPDPGWTEQPC